MLLAGALLLPAVRRAAGPGALTGVRRVAWVGLLATLVGAVAGRLVTGWLLAGRPANGASALAAGLLGGIPAVVGFALVGWWFEAGASARPPGRAPRVLLVLATSGGGVGRHVAALARWLHDHDVPVRVAGPAATDADFGLSATGASFSPVRIADRPHPSADLRAVLRLRGLAGGVDVIHAHGLRAGALAVLAARTRRRRPRLLVTLHNALVGTGRTALAHRVLTRIVARGADQLLVVSPDLGAQLRARGARRVEAALVPAPAGTVRTPSDQVRAGLGVGPGERLLVTVARLAPQKGLDLLLDAVGRLPADVRVRAVIAGGGPLEGVLAARIAAERLPVTLLGWRDDVPDLLAAADVVIVPSVWEGQPLVVQEALRLGAPVLATDVGGVRQLTGEAAVLVPSGDPDALAAALTTLLTNPTAIATLRDSSMRQGQRLPTADDAGRQVLRLYGQLLGDPSAAEPGRPGIGGGEPADSLKARGAADS
jgi:glycosyltransferase involved in cell wall biosynthesis